MISPAVLASIAMAKPPRVQGDSLWGNVASMLPFDGANNAQTFTDAKGLMTWAAFGTSAADVKLSTSVKKFGSASLVLPGNESGIQATGSPLIGTQQFALQGWFKTANTTSPYQVIVGNYNAASGDWVLTVTANGRLEFYESTGNTDIYSTTGIDLRDNAWHYYSVVRAPFNRLSMGIDGTEVVHVDSIASNLNYNGAIRYGHNNFLAGFVGNLDDCRITIGASRPHTMPTVPFPTIG